MMFIFLEIKLFLVSSNDNQMAKTESKLPEVEKVTHNGSAYKWNVECLSLNTE